MSTYNIIAFMISMATIISYVNHRFIKMQPTIAIMAGSLLLSLSLIIMGSFGYGIQAYAKIAILVNSFDFHDVLMEGMLSFLLFAGALNVNIDELNEVKWEIATLAIFGTIASCLIIATGIYFILHYLGIAFSFNYCLLFGALISPTDPIAVMATLKEVKAPKKLSVKIAGESLFNDGVAIVLFITIYKVTFGYTTEITPIGVLSLFLQQAFGGIGYGIGLGLLGSKLMEPIDDRKIEILITLVIATGGYSLAQSLAISGPLAMVVAGIFIGNRSRTLAKYETSDNYLHEFWELIDDVLNAVLFLLMGFEILSIQHFGNSALPAILAIPLSLTARALTVALPMGLFKLKKSYDPYATSIIIWGGLRGGLAVALALVIPGTEAQRALILTMTYAIVLFSILIQGSTASILIKKSKAS